MDLVKCERCSSFGLTFRSEFIYPFEYLEGKQTADIWIIGLNPKGEIGNIDPRTKEQLENFSPESHSYFHNFKKVSKKLYANWESGNSRVAHTDLVKCFLPSFPPTPRPEDKVKIIENCKAHLIMQIKKYKPKVIVCNGSDVCREILKFFPSGDIDEDGSVLTSYKAENEGHQFWIILSGFVGRIDDRNKRRLGQELEKILEIEGIHL